MNLVQKLENFSKKLGILGEQEQINYVNGTLEKLSIQIHEGNKFKFKSGTIIVDGEKGGVISIPIKLSKDLIGKNIAFIERAQRELFWYRKTYELFQKKSTEIDIMTLYKRREFKKDSDKKTGWGITYRW